MIAAQSAAEGFAVGRILRLDGRRGGTSVAGSRQVPLRDAIERVRADLGRLAGNLPRAEAELFEPEARILEEVASRLLAREAGVDLRDAIIAETSCGCTDLVLDLRMRLLHALEGSSGADLSAAVAQYGRELVVVIDLVTPTIVASLPREVVAVIGVLQSAGPRRDAGRNSHAAILARSRGLPMAYVTADSLGSVPNGSWIVVEAGGEHASLHLEPDEASLAEARERQLRDAMERLRNDVGPDPLAHLGVEMRVNVASPQDDIPAAADGVGLVRTEMMFADRLTPPGESEQLDALLLIAAKARGRPIVVRLFDAGGDKPLPWLGGASDPSRGIRRLMAHPDVLSTQLRSLARASERADVRVLLPFVLTPGDVDAVRRCAAPILRIGAMIESPDAVDAAEAIASAADFVSIGTNDLTATTLGLDRTASAPELHPRVLALVRRAADAAHARGRRATICGEMAADERGARIAVGLGADVLSVSPARLTSVRRALSRSTALDCREEAEAAVARPMLKVAT